MSSEDPHVKWYLENISLYDELTKEVLRTTEDNLKLKNIEYVSIISRTKSIESFKRKIGSKGVTDPEDITDFSGIRIVACLSRDLDNIVEALTRDSGFKILKVDNKIDELGEDRIGYRSIHIIGTLTSTNKRLDNRIFEIQVRSILDDAWAQLSHDKNYKLRDIMPNNLKRMFNLLSGSFESIETMFTEIFNQVEQFSKNYQAQFEIFLTEKPTFAQMLSVLKICSEIQLPTTSMNIHNIQNKIFDTEFKPQLLENWVQEKSGQWEFIDETASSSIVVPKGMLSKIFDFFATDYFITLINKYSISSSFGKYYGKHIIDNDRHFENVPLDKSIFNLFKLDSSFRLGFASGISEIFLSFKEKLQESLLKLCGEYPDFRNQLSWGLGNVIDKLPEEIQEKVWLLAESNKESAFSIVYGFLTRINFDELSRTLQRRIFEISKKDARLLNWIGYYLGVYFHSLEDKLQDEIILLTEKSSEFSANVFMYLLHGGKLFTLRESLQEKIWQMALENKDITHLLGQGLVSAYNFFDYDSARSKNIVEFIGKSDGFAMGLGYGISKWMYYFTEDQQHVILNLVEQNDVFAEGFFFDLAYNNKSHFRKYYLRYKEKTGKRIKRKIIDVNGISREEPIDERNFG